MSQQISQSFAPQRCLPPQFVEEIQQNRDVYRAFLSASRIPAQRHYKAHAVRRQIQVSKYVVWFQNLRSGPDARFVDCELISFGSVVGYHDVGKSKSFKPPSSCCKARQAPARKEDGASETTCLTGFCLTNLARMDAFLAK